MSLAATKSPASTLPARAHWHQRATELAVLDCHLLELLPWEANSLNALPSATYEPLIRQISSFVDRSCELTGKNTLDEIERSMAKAIWRFVKSLKPELQPFGDY